MAIAIIGRGGMGTALARRFEEAGEKTTLLGRRGTVPKDAGTIFLVVPHGETENALAAAGDLGERILVDVTNPIGPGLNLAVGLTTSAAEEIQKRLPRAKVVKAFNTVFAELLDLDYTEHGNPPQVPYAGDDVAAKAQVARLITAIGFEPFDCGLLKTARYLEPMGGLIVDLAYGQGRGTGFSPRVVQY